MPGGHPAVVEAELVADTDRRRAGEHDEEAVPFADSAHVDKRLARVWPLPGLAVPAGEQPHGEQRVLRVAYEIGEEAQVAVAVDESHVVIDGIRHFTRPGMEADTGRRPGDEVLADALRAVRRAAQAG